jgi:homoserine dehydrogenase
MNLKRKRLGIIGNGGIAKALTTRLSEAGHTPLFTMNRGGAYAPDGTSLTSSTSLPELFAAHGDLRPDAICIAIPTSDKGEAAYQYIRDAAALNIAVVTCEKGSLAYHAEHILPHVKSGAWKVRYSAAVGGGTLMLPYLAMRQSNERLVDIQAVINGTCNFVFHQTASGGRTLGEACDEAVRLGYAEPGATDPLSLLNGELHDVRMKTCVLFNTILARDVYINPRDLGALTLTENSLEEISRKSGQYRLVITFSNHPHQRLSEYAAGTQFITNVDGWTIQGGFRDLQKEPELQHWLPAGVSNAIHITEGKLGSGGRYTLTGPGAGHEPTTSALLNDIASL